MATSVYDFNFSGSLDKHPRAAELVADYLNTLIERNEPADLAEQLRRHRDNNWELSIAVQRPEEPIYMDGKYISLGGGVQVYPEYLPDRTADRLIVWVRP